MDSLIYLIAMNKTTGNGCAIVQSYFMSPCSTEMDQRYTHNIIVIINYYTHEYLILLLSFIVAQHHGH